jgi:hypothetical protein
MLGLKAAHKLWQAGFAVGPEGQIIDWSPTPSSGDEAQESSPPLSPEQWQEWADQIQTEMIILKQKVLNLEAGPQSPPEYGQPIMEEAQPGVIHWITMAGGWDVDVRRTKEAIICTIRPILPSQPPDMNLLGGAEST